MRLITKGPEPVELLRYRAVPGASYDGANFTPVKDAIRAALLRDQGRLCCYCMQRISSEPRVDPANPEAKPEPWMKVEHWHPQEFYPAKALLWRNLLGACWGGKGLPGDAQHCDARKGMTEIALDPSNPSHIETLSMRSDGTLCSSDARFQRELDDVLGLNLDALKAERARVFRGAIKALLALHRGRAIPNHAYAAAADDLESPLGDGALPAHCGVVRLYLRKRFRAER